MIYNIYVDDVRYSSSAGDTLIGLCIGIFIKLFISLGTDPEEVGAGRSESQSQKNAGHLHLFNSRKTSG